MGRASEPMTLWGIPPRADGGYVRFCNPGHKEGVEYRALPAADFDALVAERDALAERVKVLEGVLTKIAKYPKPVVCEHYETCHHDLCNFGYFAQTLAADTLYGTTTEMGDAALRVSPGENGGSK